MNATNQTWTKIKSRLSDSYWVCDQDGELHVYRRGTKWIRAHVRNNVATSSSQHKTKYDAMHA